MTRAIVFAEVPSFYATVEIAQDPALVGRPLIVGGDPRKRGLVQAASPEALAAGVEPEMPTLEALSLCPGAKLVRTDMALYREVSRRLVACLRRVFPQLETFGLGGAFFDVTGSAEPPEQIAERLRDLVREELSLPLRVGIASGKFLARLAAEEAGVDALARIPPGGERDFLAPLPVTRLEGVGRKTAAALAEAGAGTIGEVAALGRERLEAGFGAHGLRIHQLACAVDDAPVRATRHAQSLSRELTIRAEPLDRAVLEETLQDLTRQLEAELARQGLATARVTLKIRYADAGTQTRSQALGAPATTAAELRAVAIRLLDRTQVGSRPVRGLAVQLSKLAPAAEAERQLPLFPPSD
ncbi:MAG: DNA polymerase IV [Myxococcota bacterium]|nr:DNA polymerase IV [Myxococcota bacterium]